MNKLAIVYWSGTGNTQKMAACIAEGAKTAGAEVTLLEPAEFSAARWPEFNVVAFGCPSMGTEQLEEDAFEPMFAGIEGTLGGKKIALFGSYGWGDGQWMRDWVARAETAGADVYQGQGLMVNETPGDAELEACRQFGAGFVKD